MPAICSTLLSKTLNGLLIETSRGSCNWLVRPPWITARWVFTSLNLFFVVLLICALNCSGTNKADSFQKASRMFGPHFFNPPVFSRMQNSVFCLLEHTQLWFLHSNVTPTGVKGGQMVARASLLLHISLHSPTPLPAASWQAPAYLTRQAKIGILLRSAG